MARSPFVAADVDSNVGERGDGPYAVILVDHVNGVVQYANTPARQLAPDVQLPVDASVWTAAVGLAGRDPATEPLSPIIDLTSMPAEARLVTATWSTQFAAAGDKLWITAFPMDEAPAPFSGYTVVVLQAAHVSGADTVAAAGAESTQPAFSMSDFTASLAMSRQPDVVVEMTAHALVPRIATMCAVYTYDDVGRVTPPLIIHQREPADANVTRVLEQVRRADITQSLSAQGPLLQVLRGEQPYVFLRGDSGELPDTLGPLPHAPHGAIAELAIQAMLAIPMRSRDGIVGAILACTDDRRPMFSNDDVTAIRDLTVRAGLILENTQLYKREHAAAEALQRGLLPRLPTIDGIDVAAAYLPAADKAAVGGDWYDVFLTRSDKDDDGVRTVGVVVGDVMGHDFESASGMGKLSTILHTLCWGGASPHDVLTAADDVIEGGELDILATCLCATLSLDGSGAFMRYANAGHPPALLRSAAGDVREVRDGRSAMIGIRRLTSAYRPRSEASSVRLEAGSTLVCFTDGLTDELGGRDLDEGIARLREVIADLPAAASAHQIIEKISTLVVDRKDDVAVVAIRLL